MLLAYRHGLRVSSELVALRWDQVDFKTGSLHVNRAKNGIASVHLLRGPELRVLRKLRRKDTLGAYVFMTERDGPMTVGNVRKLVQRADDEARLGFAVHPHMLRHAGDGVAHGQRVAVIRRRQASSRIVRRAFHSWSSIDHRGVTPTLPSYR